MCSRFFLSLLAVMSTFFAGAFSALVTQNLERWGWVWTAAILSVVSGITCGWCIGCYLRQYREDTEV